MSDVFSSAAGLLVLFTFGVMASVGGILAAANGLSSLHKDVLVAFSVGFPSVILIVLLVLMRAAHRA